MSKLITLVICLLLFGSLAFGQNYDVLWEKSAAQGTMPSWFGSSTERGFGYGFVAGKGHLFVVSRNGGTNVLAFEAATGDSVLALEMFGVSGGTFTLNDADVSADGIIFACNLTVNASTSNFKVYRWDTVADTADVVIDYNDATGGRFGDKFTVVGSTADNSIVIYAAKASTNTVVKFTTADNGASFTPTEITVANATGNTPSVGPLGVGDANFFVNGAGTHALLYDNSGAQVGEVPGSILGTGSNAIRYHETMRNLYAVSFQYGSTKENARVMDVTFGADNASSYLETPSLGSNANGNGTGDVALQDNGDGTFNVYVLSSNNGFGAYKVNMAPDLFFSEYLEGSSNNKALEIYNPLSTTVDLSYYRLERANNGATSIQDSVEFSASGDTLATGAVYVVGNPSADQAILDVSDTTHTITFFNGDDYLALAKNVGGTWVPIDAIGVLGEDPGSAWDVAGVPGATNEQTLVRKAMVKMGTTDWAASAGTEGTNSQWVVLEQNNFSFLGDHPAEFARVQVVHNSADANADTVDVWLNDALLLDDFAFRTASPFVTAPAGVEFDITIQPKTSTDTTNGLWRKSYTLADGETYILIASGIVIPTGYDPAPAFDIAVAAGGQESAGDAGNTDLLIYHGSTDAPTVDIVADGIATIVDDISYFEFTDNYLALPTADYKLIVTDATGEVGVVRYKAPLATLGLDGASAVVFASGFLDPTKNNDGPAFGVFVALPSGGDAVALPVNEDPVKVTFRANTSRVWGIVDSTGGVDIRGALQNPGWTPLADPMMSDGGDYWSIEWEFADSLIGTSLDYKYGGTVKNPVDGSVASYWENDIPGADGAASSPNRTIKVPFQDTVWPVQYVGHRGAPYTDDPDSIDVFFRINMSTLDGFDSANDVVFIAGSMPNIGWDAPHKPLTREADSDYWNIATRIDPDKFANFKYTRGQWDGREEANNRGISPINGDTTIQFVYYNDVLPQGATGVDTVEVRFRVDMTNAIAKKGFTPGDSLVVRWGYDGSAIRQDAALLNEFGTDFYSVVGDAEKVSLGENLVYQYYLIPEGRDEEREIYYDFNDPDQDTQERRKITLPASKPASTFEINDVVNSDVDARRQPTFRNSSPLTKDVLVTWEVDLRPAYYQVKLGGDTLLDIQGTINVGPAQLDSIFTWGVWMQGPAVGGWSNPQGADWGPDLRLNLDKKMYDDGSNGDASSGDSIYTRQVQYYGDPDSNDVIGQVYKFGIYGGDNEGGKGGFGNNHVANIDDAQPNFTIHTQFGSINPPFYSSWDFDNRVPTDVEDIEEAIVIRDPNLRENYPNPFNPTTTLTFELPKQMKVQLVVYDVLGRKVTELINGVQRQGIHKVVWNGADSHGRPVSSGVYFYRMVTDNYVRTLKMTLMR